jgi:hypothetical protein
MPIVTISIALRAKSPPKQGSRQKTLTLKKHANFIAANSWLSLARRDEAMENLLASWDPAEPVKKDGLGA